MDKLVVEGTLSKTGGDTYIIKKVLVSLLFIQFQVHIFFLWSQTNCPPEILTMQKSDYEFTVVKQEINGQAILVGDKTPKSNDHMYMKVIVMPALIIIVYVELSISSHMPYD